MQHKIGSKTSFYRPRNHEASSFFKVVRDYFDEFERIYPEKYEKQFGFWRSVIRTSIDKFRKCGDVKQGFARVRCPDCKEEFFVTPFALKQATRAVCSVSSSIFPGVHFHFPEWYV